MWIYGWFSDKKYILNTEILKKYLNYEKKKFWYLNISQGWVATKLCYAHIKWFVPNAGQEILTFCLQCVMA